MTLADAQYDWNPVGMRPRNGVVGDVIVYSRRAHLTGLTTHPPYTFCGGAANHPQRFKPGYEALAHLLIDFHTMVVRDGIDPQIAHREFLKIDEYRQFISPDCSGAER